MDDYVGRTAQLRRGFETGRASFVAGEVVLVTGHHRGRLEIQASDGRVARQIQCGLVELVTGTPVEGSA